MNHTYRQQKQAQRRAWRLRLWIILIICLTAVLVGVIAIAALRGRSYQQEAADTGVAGFAIDDPADQAAAEQPDLPEPTELEAQTSLAKGESLRLRLRYDPQKVRSVEMVLLKPTGEEVYKSGQFPLGTQGDFSLTTDTRHLAVGSYKVELRNQDGAMLVQSDLTITEPAAL